MKYICYNTLEFKNKNKNKNMDTQNVKLFKTSAIDNNISFDEVKTELLTLFKSPNPLQIYLNSQKIKDMFSDMLSALTLKIKD